MGGELTNGNITTITDRTGVKTQPSYNLNDNLVKVEDSLGGKTTYAYDSIYDNFQDIRYKGAEPEISKLEDSG